MRKISSLGETRSSGAEISSCIHSTFYLHRQVAKPILRKSNNSNQQKTCFLSRIGEIDSIRILLTQIFSVNNVYVQKNHEFQLLNSNALKTKNKAVVIKKSHAVLL